MSQNNIKPQLYHKKGLKIVNESDFTFEYLYDSKGMTMHTSYSISTDKLFGHIQPGHVVNMSLR